MTETRLDGFYRWAWFVLLGGWLAASGCICYGGGEPPPEDDDTDPEDATYDNEYPEYDVDGFYLDIGRDDGSGTYSGIVILESGKLSEWSGLGGAHSDEVWRASLTTAQLDRIIDAVVPATFFEADIDESGGPECVFQFRLGLQENVAVHPAGDVPEELSGAYEELDDILDSFGIDHGCS